MNERRTLVQGMKATPTVDELEKAFVFDTAKKQPDVSQSEPERMASKPNPLMPKMTGRVPVTARCRVEIASLLKRVSLQREMDGVEPHYVQDIVEEALSNWLSEKGYL